MKKSFDIKQIRAAVTVEYALLLAVFMGTFIYFGKTMYDLAKLRAESAQSQAVLNIPCVEIGSSEYLLGSKAEDRAVCTD
jgi:hypothetical protein